MQETRSENRMNRLKDQVDGWMDSFFWLARICVGCGVRGGVIYFSVLHLLSSRAD